MGVSTFVVGLLPGYATIGVAAPILLFVLRIVQGLAVGGQWGGAVLIATEYAPPHRRGWYGSFPQLGVPIAVIVSNGIFLGLEAGLGKEAFVDWGWDYFSKTKGPSVLDQRSDAAHINWDDALDENDAAVRDSLGTSA